MIPSNERSKKLRVLEVVFCPCAPWPSGHCDQMQYSLHTQSRVICDEKTQLERCSRKLDTHRKALSVTAYCILDRKFRMNNKAYFIHCKTVMSYVREAANLQLT